MVRKDRVGRHTGAEFPQDQLNRNARTANDRFAGHDIRVYFDAFMGHGVSVYPIFWPKGLTFGTFNPKISDETKFVRVHAAMPSPTYTLFRNAILSEQQVVCTYSGRHRELCPHIIGTDGKGEEAVLAWQFGGDSSGKLPQWRCLKLANVRDARARPGRWHEGGSHKTTQKCIGIDLDINIDVRKLR
jgi:hypothetical protein